MTITLDLTPETEARLRLDAGDRGLDIKAYLQQYLASARQTSDGDYIKNLLRPLTEEEIQRRIALMEEFSANADDSDEEGETYEDVLRSVQEHPFSLREYHAGD